MKSLKFFLKKFRYSRKRTLALGIVFLLCAGFGIGYAFLNTTLNVNGAVNVASSTWDIHFETVTPLSGSIAPTTSPTISDDTTISFGTTLEEPGDYYGFTVDVVNDGTYNAKIDSLVVTPTLTAAQQEYFEYTVTYSNGVNIQVGDALNPGDTETLKVYFKYKENADSSKYPGEDIDFDFSVTMNYIQGTGNAVAHPAFDEATPWADVIAGIQNGTINPNVGDTKTVDLGSTLGTHTLRVANTTTPAECATTGFSQTSCGLVLEFADIITTHNMNSTDSNVGGWPASSMRTYVNSDIYNALPIALKNAIIDTTVVSGHGSTTGETNFTSTDKLYLLSTKEVWGKEETSNVITDDSAEAETRQLDYYAGLNVTTSSYSGAIKQYNNSNSYWWLRSAYSGTTYIFYGVTADGDWDRSSASGTYGVSPAFRLR